jgi:DNA-binding winged helix-turn-helix (wHTH) protein
MRPTCCHYCGQALPVSRMGIKFTPIEGRILDLVTNAGEGGISNDDLYEIVLSARRSERHTLNVHIGNLNDKLADTGYQIVGRTVRCLEKTGGRFHADDALSEEQQKALGL